MASRTTHVGVLALSGALLTCCAKSEPAVEQEAAAKAPDAAATAPDYDALPQPDTELEEKANAAVAAFRKKDTAMERFFDDSKGYAVFPSVGKGAVVVGGAHGKGVVYEKAPDGLAIVGTTTLTQGSIGFQIGGQVFSEIIFFKDEASLKKYKSGTTEFAGTASAVAADAGASVDAAYEKGVAVFTMGEKGLMLQASIGGQGFSFTPK